MADKTQSNSPVAAPTTGAAAKVNEVIVQSLKRPNGVWAKQWADDQKDSMGSMQHTVTLHIGDREVPIMVGGKIAKVGTKPSVAPHFNEFIRLLVAHAFSGRSDKGDGYALGVALNLNGLNKELIEPLVTKNAAVYVEFGARREKMWATVKQLLDLALLRASIITETRRRYPEAVEEGKVTTPDEVQVVEVAFVL